MLRILIALLIFLFSSCAPILELEESKPDPRVRDKMLAIFMDGTGNKPNKHPNKNTNIKKLYDLRDTSYRSFYIEGVGTKMKVIGTATGWGTSARIRRAYIFLSRNYNPGDSIAMFGFSRGAYFCRILSNIIYTAGIPDLENTDERTRKKIARKIYKHYINPGTASERRLRIARFIQSWNAKHTTKLQTDTSGNIMISVMGLWDTVEALGAPDFKEDFISPNPKHLNQIDNINTIYHAVSLDDNRARLYTPVLITTKEVANSTTRNINDIVDEVWFSGSHSDLGGNHKKHPQMRNISLNWMLAKTKRFNLFQSDSFPELPPFPHIHNMQKNFFFVISTKNVNRNISAYYDSIKHTYNNGKLKIHKSVIRRLEAGHAPRFKSSKKRKDWFDMEPFVKCFITDGYKKKFIKPCTCIEVVN